MDSNDGKSIDGGDGKGRFAFLRNFLGGIFDGVGEGEEDGDTLNSIENIIRFYKFVLFKCNSKLIYILKNDYFTFFFMSSPVIINPFIGIVGTAGAEARFGVETLLLFLVIGLLTLDKVGTGREGIGGAGAEALCGFMF